MVGDGTALPSPAELIDEKKIAEARENGSLEGREVPFHSSAPLERWGRFCLSVVSIFGEGVERVSRAYVECVAELAGGSGFGKDMRRTCLFCWRFRRFSFFCCWFFLVRYFWSWPNDGPSPLETLFVPVDVFRWLSLLSPLL